MFIRNARSDDLPYISRIYEDARNFMRQNGNHGQWNGNYPSTENIVNDIAQNCLYVCCEQDNILAVFYFRVGNDPTYEKIYDGCWLNESDYAVIHRIAVSESSHGKGVASFCFDFTLRRFGNIKIDTHKDNIPMQRSLIKNGFKYCGIIHLLSGDERLAYQKSR